MLLSDEFRLAILLLLNAVVLISAWLAARCGSNDAVQRLTDTMLLYFAVQYAAVCLPGVLHVLSIYTMGATALGLSAGVIWIGLRKIADRSPLKSTGETPMPLIFVAAGVFVMAISAGVIEKQMYVPVIDSDAMTYHVPVAVQWLQTGRLSLLPVWFFNPANTFSPLAGSTFIAWLIAPLGNDAIARGVQFPALILLFLAALQLGRAVGLPDTLAALTATAVAVSRPFNSELLSARDDTFLAAFIVVALAGGGREALRDRFGPWRLGLAVGLAAATKYTFIFAAPVLLLVIDAPIKSGWKKRQWFIAVGTALFIAGPWYLRNILLTGNPLYPVDLKLFGHTLWRGLFEVRRSARLATWNGLNEALIYGFHAPPPLLLAALLMGWLAAIVRLRGAAWRTPLHRACILGLPFCFFLFLIKSPYSEVRFLFPSLVSVFIVVGLAIHHWVSRRSVAIGLAMILPVIALATSYKAIDIVGEIVSTALLSTAIVVGLLIAIRRLSLKIPRVKSYASGVAVLVAVMLIYVEWHAYIEHCQQARLVYYSAQYAQNADAWQFISENVPSDAKLAYANTYFIYPLYGSLLERRVFYVPTDKAVTDFVHQPRVNGTVPGEQIESMFSHLLNGHADREVWLERLLHSGAGYLYVARHGMSGEPPELKFAEEDPTHFARIFNDDGGSVYQIHP